MVLNKEDRAVMSPIIIVTKVRFKVLPEITDRDFIANYRFTLIFRVLNVMTQIEKLLLRAERPF